MFKILSIIWPIWKVTTKRFGPVVGLVLTLIALIGLSALKRELRHRDLDVAGTTSRIK